MTIGPYHNLTWVLKMTRAVNGGPGFRAPVRTIEPGPVNQFSKPAEEA